ncbi:hypothetical protein [Streptomyces sp. CC208A]|uniref:hypothetical protein n=1 Tax=Streptomyces sp. CC208A TaxID=3044573 RepID=UPI0024A93FA3|nr:hypothetical protein [Streptomyces sp. CC208A]
MTEPSSEASGSVARTPPSDDDSGRHLAWPKDRRRDRYLWELARGPITAFGESKPLASWSKDPRCAVSREALRTRLALGWSPEDAITRQRHDKPALEHTYQGRTLTLRGWADQSGIKYHTLYNRITKFGMPFEEALLKGADGPDFTMHVTAFGETKPLCHWGVDPRAACSTSTLRLRLIQGWDPEQAITEEPQNRSTLGTGTPHRAYGLSMGLEDWARYTKIPADNLRYVMTRHELPLESALHALGWSPHTQPTVVHDLITITTDQLRPGDRVLGVTSNASHTPVITVRRPLASRPPQPSGRAPAPPVRTAPPAAGPSAASPAPAPSPAAPHAAKRR